MDRPLANWASLAAASRTCPTPPMSPPPGLATTVCRESTTKAKGRSSFITSTIRRRCCSERRYRFGSWIPRRSALSFTWAGASSPETYSTRP